MFVPARGLFAARNVANAVHAFKSMHNFLKIVDAVLSVHGLLQTFQGRQDEVKVRNKRLSNVVNCSRPRTVSSGRTAFLLQVACTWKKSCNRHRKPKTH